MALVKEFSVQCRSDSGALYEYSLKQNEIDIYVVVLCNGAIMFEIKIEQYLLPNSIAEILLAFVSATNKNKLDEYYVKPVYLSKFINFKYENNKNYYLEFMHYYRDHLYYKLFYNELVVSKYSLSFRFNVRVIGLKINIEVFELMANKYVQILDVVYKAFPGARKAILVDLIKYHEYYFTTTERKSNIIDLMVFNSIVNSGNERKFNAEQYHLRATRVSFDNNINHEVIKLCPNIIFVESDENKSFDAFNAATNILAYFYKNSNGTFNGIIKTDHPLYKYLVIPDKLNLLFKSGYNDTIGTHDFYELNNVNYVQGTLLQEFTLKNNEDASIVHDVDFLKIVNSYIFGY